jgi:hypothetical protein
MENQSARLTGESSENPDSFSDMKEIQTSTKDEAFPPVPFPASKALEKMIQEVGSFQNTPILESISKKFARTIKTAKKTKR